MSLFDGLDAKNFELFAAKHYVNPQCSSIEEFHEDLLKFKYIKKLFTRYTQHDDLQVRLILNHIIILYNVFEQDACTALLFFKIPQQHWGILKSFLTFLNYMPQEQYSIDIDQHVKEELEKI